MKKLKKYYVFGLLASLSVAAQAAVLPGTDPAAVQRLNQDRLDRFRQEESLQKALPIVPEISVPEQESATKEASDIKNIPVSRFDVDHSDLLSVDEIKLVLTPYQGRDVSLKELFEAVAKLNQLYDAKNIKTARAILPPQEVNDGTVKIQLIEARLGSIIISGLKSVRSDFVADRIHLKSGDLISVSQLEDDLIRFNALYEPKLRADVRAGAEVGKTDIAIEVQEAQKYHLTTFADNAGRDTVGEARVGAIYRVNNLAGINDSIQVVATGTSGSRSYGLSYSIPVSHNDMRLDVSYNYGNIKVVNGPFVPLDITGSSRDLSVGLTQPFSVGINRQWAAYSRLSSRNSISQFSGFTQQDLNLKVFALGLRGEAHYNTYAWSLDNSLNFGTKSLGGDAQFSYYRANVSRVDRLADRLQLLTKAGLQYSFSQVIPSGEQFQVGGLYSVRGFSEGLLSGRNGYFGSIELRAALNAPPQDSPTGLPPLVQALVFLDHGAALPYRPGQSRTKDDFLTGAGVGLMMDFGSRISTRLTFAYPLDNNPSEMNPRSPRILAGVNVSWF
ncbi:MAG: ShlB/FhaC/HecB family hemolysin secretion/activation protein [Methylotenera sp.]|nr:ShlB/FhaC/HecB family hemolysin secretion/activation protein [Methylotenera sp.]MDO9232323.1 ShlB/FhaC/HecB family hemolysin secretion/activation protein [Methylotenera sp.]MDP2102147.1 ShlB/FhaC/HecB family hemolysin secretion/activation protein [Methylotenera sp.]MDP2281107.1 ShlB/FhaC/HecB family hemolysin secretion/activation protein [Methylotenera sp.]MDP2404007.1 ShlB/FhaC/HecB family hemolysin secretion/activation protein [Methylotenera sp.]